jgi:hypothetical protein
MKRILYVYFSPLASVPLFGYAFYAIQILFIKASLTQSFYMSAKEKRYMREVVGWVEQDFDAIYCYTIRIGHPLVFFTKPIALFLDSSHIKELHLYSQDIYNRIVWTLVSTTFAQKDCLKKMSSLWSDQLPSIIPIAGKKSTHT